MQESSSLLSISPDRSPSFDTYSFGKLAEIAARVVQEFDDGTVSDSNFYDFSTGSCEQPEQESHDEKNDNNDEDVSDEEFEFSIVSRDREFIPITADDIFYNGQIRPVYPLFNTDLISNALCKINEETTTIKTKATSNRLPLRQLFSEERELTSTSCSSSEADELDGAEPGTYCVWTPKKAGESSPRMCKKSGSTGSSKRWKFRDLLNRSHSDGKDTFVFLASINNNKKAGEAKQRTPVSNAKEAKGGVEEESVKRNRAVKESEKRRSYLPYRQDLVGVFTNVYGQTRNFRRY
ncbi:hypothetical protein HS088_TW02G00891 [Tripterygium wilfordii]|uniref:Uncharacterized protein n=1 Tax=Tripterygium wilfordii TaxID=458696 RepID=A0A7J7DZP2_TRIWF|nr:uncharacterized protein LOC120016600 [Tripterygium wilfordii]KAF5751872.1 hypothetical protein HS088_TW02G00891 [Tripterygium wilfordii]